MVVKDEIHGKTARFLEVCVYTYLCLWKNYNW